MILLFALRKSWLLALGVFVALMVGTALFNFLAPRTYTATAIVALVPDTESNPAGDLVQLAVPLYVRLADSPSFIGDLAETYDEDPDALGSSVHAVLLPSTNTIEVSVEWSSASRAAVLANGVSEQLVSFSARDPMLSAYIAAPAEPPSSPSFPPTQLVIIIGTVAAIVAAAAAALLRTMLSTATVRRPGRHTHHIEDGHGLLAVDGDSDRPSSAVHEFRARPRREAPRR